MTAHLIVNYNIADGYKAYQKGAGPALKIGSEAKVLVLDKNSQRLEGDNAGASTVVLEFESMDRAREIYDPGDYQAVLPMRLDATSNHFAVLVEGFSMPG